MKACLLLLALALLAPAAGAEIYKWTDAQGRVHFGDKPTDKTRAEEVEVRDYKPGTGQDVLDVYQRTDRIYDARERQRQEDAAKERETTAAEAKKKDQCFEARDRERRMDRPVVFVDDYGKPIKVSDEERRQKLQELRQWIADNCP